jgi:hypothetical protein
MKNFSRTMSSRLMSSVLLAVIVGSLCFSVGEGLRLTPFPVSTSTQNEELSFANPSGNTTVSQYGPLDVPAQTQKRSKRQATDISGPTTARTRYAVPQLSSLLDYDSAEAASVLFVTRPAGRAPPFLF